MFTHYVIGTVLAKVHNSFMTTDITSDMNTQSPSEFMPNNVQLDLSKYSYHVINDLP